MSGRVVDNLTTIERVKAMLGKPLTASPDDYFMNMLVVQVSNEITRSCNRTHFLASNPINPITQFYDGTGSAELVLDQWPIQCPVLTGNTTNGSPTITGLSSTTGLFVNQSVTGLAFQPPQGVSIPPGTPPLVIQSVDSATQVTCNGNAQLTATGTQIGFGVAVWWNQYAYGVPGSFQAANMLGEGANYFIDRDGPNQNTCHSGILGAINWTWPASWSWGGGGGGGTGWSGSGPDLSPTQMPGPKNIQVQATIGYSCLPPDLEMAAIWAVNKARVMRTFGQMPQSESDDGYSYSLAEAKAVSANAVSLGLLGGYISEPLARYRIAAVGR